MKLATWNINSGDGSFSHKKDVFAAWVAQAKPDLLLLQEVHPNLLTKDASGTIPIEKATGMILVNYVNTLDANDQQTSKCLPVLRAAGTSADGRPLQLQGLDARRMLMKTNVTIAGTTYAIWDIHANASKSGGAAATKAAIDYLTAETKAGHATIVAGDFNCDISGVAFANKKVSTRFDGKPLACTQWTPTFGTAANKDVQAASFGLTKTFYTGTLKPNGVIDYALHSDAAKVAGQKNCGDEATWYGIVSQFDHCPTLYALG